MLSTVAMYHSELSDSGEGEKKGGEGEGRGGGREEGVRERASLVDDGIARMRLESSSGEGTGFVFLDVAGVNTCVISER